MIILLFTFERSSSSEDPLEEMKIQLKKVSMGKKSGTDCNTLAYRKGKTRYQEGNNLLIIYKINFRTLSQNNPKKVRKLLLNLSFFFKNSEVFNT